jgi:hypothetical protein
MGSKRQGWTDQCVIVRNPRWRSAISRHRPWPKVLQTHLNVEKPSLTPHPPCLCRRTWPTRRKSCLHSGQLTGLRPSLILQQDRNDLIFKKSRSLHPRHTRRFRRRLIQPMMGEAYSLEYFNREPTAYEAGSGPNDGRDLRIPRSCNHTSTLVLSMP